MRWQSTGRAASQAEMKKTRQQTAVMMIDLFMVGYCERKSTLDQGERVRVEVVQLMKLIRRIGRNVGREVWNQVKDYYF